MFRACVGRTTLQRAAFAMPRQYFLASRVSPFLGVRALSSAVPPPLPPQEMPHEPHGGAPPPPPPPKRARGRWLRAAGLGSTVLLTMGKAKTLLGVLKLAKFSTLISLGLSVGAYSMILGLPYALGLVGQLVFHEASHALMMYRLGIPFSPMVFVPFIGAAVSMQKRPKSAAEEAVVGLAGPVGGLVAAAALSGIGIATGSDLLILLAEGGFMLNLFNMLPMGMMDGGKVAAAVSRWVLAAGLAGGTALAVSGVIANPIFYLILVLGAFSTWSRFFGTNSRLELELPPGFYDTPTATRWKLIAAYVAVLAALLGGMAINGLYRKTPNELRRARGEKNSALDDSTQVATVEQTMDRWFGLSKQGDEDAQSAGAVRRKPRDEGTILELDMSSESLAFERAVMRECEGARALTGAETDHLSKEKRWKPEDHMYVYVPASCGDVLRALIQQRRREALDRTSRAR
jgi:Zn-dependent protease